MSFRDQLKARREACGLTRAALAEQLGVSASAVGNYETGVSFPKEDVLLRLFEIKAFSSKRIAIFSLLSISSPQSITPNKTGVILLIFPGPNFSLKNEIIFSLESATTNT